MTTTTEQNLGTEALADLSGIEEHVLTRLHIADLLRHGAQGTTQSIGWGNGGEACFLSAAALAARDLGVID